MTMAGTLSPITTQVENSRSAIVEAAERHADGGAERHGDDEGDGDAGEGLAEIGEELAVGELVNEFDGDGDRGWEQPAGKERGEDLPDRQQQDEADRLERQAAPD